MGNKEGRDKYGSMQIFITKTRSVGELDDKAKNDLLPQATIGEEITGYVSVLLKKNFPAKSLQLQFIDRENLSFKSKEIKGDMKTEIYNQKLVLTVAEFPEDMPLILKKDFPFKFIIPEVFSPSFFVGYEKTKFKLAHFLFA